ncbi:hypothetical protein GCM10009665_57440 [Kitasatospora nipponensis]|uniref:Integrase-like protein n=1 Tax=Kitasatospora nipponensis TaxID=258049 RepID=A0ABN1WSQ4_9ACTN
MAEETYRQMETTGHRGRAATSRYDGRLDCYIAWRGMGTSHLRRHRRTAGSG